MISFVKKIVQLTREPKTRNRKEKDTNMEEGLVKGALEINILQQQQRSCTHWCCTHFGTRQQRTREENHRKGLSLALAKTHTTSTISCSIPSGGILKHTTSPFGLVALGVVHNGGSDVKLTVSPIPPAYPFNWSGKLNEVWSVGGVEGGTGK